MVVTFSFLLKVMIILNFQNTYFITNSNETKVQLEFIYIKLQGNIEVNITTTYRNKVINLTLNKILLNDQQRQMPIVIWEYG